MNVGDAALRSLDPRRWIPALRWLPAYDRSWLRGDLIAGLTLAAYLLPAALGDTWNSISARRLHRSPAVTKGPVVCSAAEHLLSRQAYR